MTDFMLLSADASLWELAMKAKWDSHDFSPVVKSLQVQAIMQTQLNTLSQVGVWGDVWKPQQDMAFLLIVPSITVGYEMVFGLVVVWLYPCQACYHSLEEAIHKLVLLVDESADWAYVFIWLYEALSPSAVC